MREQVGHCDICSRTFSSFERLRTHWNKKHTEVQAISCCFCDFIVAAEPLFAKHKKEFHPKDRMACEFCAYTTGKWSKLKKHHTKVHVAFYKENIAAELLKKNFKKKTVLSSCKFSTNYRLTSSNCGNVEFRCSILEEKKNLLSTNEKTAELYPTIFKPCEKLQINHKNQTTGPQKLQLYECALENCKTCQLYHNGKQRGSEPPAENFVCDICQKSFKTLSHLASHKIVHTPLKCFFSSPVVPSTDAYTFEALHK
ncbi:zinc finger protein 675-like [Physella acuta]|uniref:zinc finger protein 675-like n=1 Tax=Physella acuta TaxID=109671 RepID=UPI0027DDD306|nr:zinc finger protein 675-like [Physella acuta]